MHVMRSGGFWLSLDGFLLLTPTFANYPQNNPTVIFQQIVYYDAVTLRTLSSSSSPQLLLYIENRIQHLKVNTPRILRKSLGFVGMYLNWNPSAPFNLAHSKVRQPIYGQIQLKDNSLVPYFDSVEVVCVFVPLNYIIMCVLPGWFEVVNVCGYGWVRFDGLRSKYDIFQLIGQLICHSNRPLQMEAWS